MVEPDEVEIPLSGGDVTDGIVRVGDTVRRPMGPHSNLVHRVLRHLEEAGVEGAPRFLGIDAAGREILSFVEGDVAGRPWPSWVGDLERGLSVARLVRRLDDAMVPFGVPADAPSRPGPPATFMGHRDITPENTVFTGGVAHALIDWDLVKPSSRVEEVANLLLWWAGWMAPEDRDPVFDGVDPAERGRALVDAYGLGEEDRVWVVPVSIAMADRSWHTMKDAAERRGGGWRRMWDDGVGDVIRRRGRWLRAEQAALHRALT